VFLTEFTSPYSLDTQRGWHTSDGTPQYLSSSFQGNISVLSAWLVNVLSVCLSALSVIDCNIKTFRCTITWVWRRVAWWKDIGVSGERSPPPHRLHQCWRDCLHLIVYTNAGEITSTSMRQDLFSSQKIRKFLPNLTAQNSKTRVISIHNETHNVCVRNCRAWLHFKYINSKT